MILESLSPGLLVQSENANVVITCLRYSFYIISGQGNYEAPDRSQNLSDILKAKGIPHNLDLWGADVDHDWPWWRKMLPFTLDRILG